MTIVYIILFILVSLVNKKILCPSINFSDRCIADGTISMLKGFDIVPSAMQWSLRMEKFSDAFCIDKHGLTNAQYKKLWMLSKFQLCF